jgi:drug/metabolite transporter (DMT)-like permease
VLSEGIGWGQMIGMLLILAGIALVARGPGPG